MVKSVSLSIDGKIKNKMMTKLQPLEEFPNIKEKHVLKQTPNDSELNPTCYMVKKG